MNLLTDQEDRHTVRTMGLVLIGLAGIVCLLTVAVALLT